MRKMQEEQMERRIHQKNVEMKQRQVWIQRERKEQEQKAAKKEHAEKVWNAVFDTEVEATLNRIRASGAELPSPPPNYPEMLGRTVTVGFRCTNRSQCE